MTIGILKAVIFIHDSNSLKDRRMVLHSLKARLRNNFNVAVTQIDDGNKWQRADLAVVGVEKDRKQINSTLSKIINFIAGFNSVELIDHEMELI